MTDKQTLKKIQKALGEDWRTVKNLAENHGKLSDQEISEKLSTLQTDIVLEDGDTIQDLIQ